MYDIIFIGDNCAQWTSLKTRYPTAKRASEFFKAQKMSMTKMFWVIWPDVVVNKEFDFSYKVSKWEEKYTHVFKNGDDYKDGICLLSKHMPVSKNEIEHKFFTNKKEVNIQASSYRPYDVVFISYNEVDAEKNYNLLLLTVPRAKRVDGVSGIHQAHIAAAKQCSTSMFWVVDGDAEIVDNFSFDYLAPKWEQDCVHVWRSRNPVNGLEYGYGGVKLLPRLLTEKVDVTATDMTTSISHKFKAIPEVSNITNFNTDAFSAWRSAFRECAKLASKTIQGQEDQETKQRLDVWCTSGSGAMFGDYALSGAMAGCKYGTAYQSNHELGKINDYDWLYLQFLEEYCVNR